MYKVRKRGGEVVDFNLSKVSAAIEKAFQSRNMQHNKDILDLLTLKVTADFVPKIRNGIISVEDIQDSVEVVLIQAGYVEIA